MLEIFANGRKVIQSDGKATISLIASIVGAVLGGGGDIAKPIIKEVGEELTEKGFKEVGGETVERTAKESAERLAEAGLVEQRQKFRQLLTEQRYDEYAQEIETIKPKRMELKDIATEDLVAIKGYTSDDYKMLNNALRSGDEKELKRLDPYIKVAESGLRQLPSFKGTVFRGTNLMTFMFVKSLLIDTKGETVFPQTI